MDAETEAMISVIDILTEYGWISSSETRDAKISVQWTEQGKRHMSGIFAAISLPKLTAEQKKCLKWLAWDEFGDQNLPPPNLL
jgi:hypothetical protein